MEKKKVTIVTHSSKFHTDDIFAMATLMLVLEKDHEVLVVRTRDQKIIEGADYVVDVGEIYDEARNRFDHHQEGRAGERDNGIPYASFGLVWKKYGVKLCGENEVAFEIDQKLVQPTDASDNGVAIFESTIKDVFPYTLDTLRRTFVPSWKEGFKDIDTIFLTMVRGAKMVLHREIIKARDGLEARLCVEKTYNESEDKRVIVFDRYYPSEEYLNKFPEPLFIIFPVDVDGTWIVQTIQNDPEEHINRKDLPASWAGKSGKELEEITGVDGAIFCHVNRFIAVAQTREAILKLAEIALQG